MKLIPTLDVIDTIDIGLTGVTQSVLSLKKVVNKKLKADKKAIIAADLAAFRANDAEKKVDAEKLQDDQSAGTGAGSRVQKRAQRCMDAVSACV